MQRPKKYKKRAESDVAEGGPYMFVHNCGVDKRIVFNSKEDFDRFEASLYLLNAIESERVSNVFRSEDLTDILRHARSEQLVAIGAYSFTQRSFHMILTPRVENGVAKFMQKLQTAYTMYFNAKYQRAGALFESSYKSTPVMTIDDLKYYFARVHLEPAVLFDSAWTEKKDLEFAKLAAQALQYRYSSIGEYSEGKFKIASPQQYPPFVKRSIDYGTHTKFWAARDRKQGKRQ